MQTGSFALFSVDYKSKHPNSSGQTMIVYSLKEIKNSIGKQLQSYTTQVYNRQVGRKDPVEANDFIRDWWDSMPQELKEWVSAVDIGDDFPFTAPDNMKILFEEKEGFSNLSFPKSA